MKTPEELAADQTWRLISADDTWARDRIQAAIVAAVEADRAQHVDPGPLVVAIARALRDRGDLVAALWVLENEDELFGSDVGPMLDSLQRDHGAWSPSGDPMPDAAPSAAARFDPEVERAVRSEARTAIAARGPREYDEHDPRL